MAKIERLTPEQEARFAEFRDHWIKIGLSTEPADRPRAEAAICEMYRQGGLPPPERIVWCGSPLSQGFTRAIVLDRASVRDSVRASVRASVGDSVWASVRDSVGDSVYGQHDAGWLAFYRYFRDAVGLEPQTEKLSGLWELAQSAGWAIPHQRICWVSERHSLLARDERGRLHSVSGPAVRYPDGWAIYAVHGVRVPAGIIEHPESITVAAIDQERNTEVRRVMVDQYGLSRYLRDSGAVLIDDSRWGKLWRRDQTNDEPILAVELLNSTPEPDGTRKTYFLRVHPECRPLLPGGRFGAPQKLTAHSAVASTFGKRAEEYHPSKQT